MLLNYTILHYNWNATFLTCAVCFVMAGAIASGINASVKIDE